MQKLRIYILCIGLLSSISWQSVNAQETSIANTWMTRVLKILVEEGQGPTVQARNLFHLSVVMYDAWAVYDKDAKPFLLGNTWGDYHAKFENFSVPEGSNIDSLQEVAIHFAAYRLMNIRLNQYSSKTRTIDRLDTIMVGFGYDPEYLSMDYQNGSAAELGNYIAHCMEEFGLQDGSNEEELYVSQFYNASNPPLRTDLPGVQELQDPNRWQPLASRQYIDKKGRDPTLGRWTILLIPLVDVFVTPEWGLVEPFALTEEDLTVIDDDGQTHLYLNPGHPPYLDYDKDSLQSEAYKWGFVLNLLWSSYLDPTQDKYIDISPGALGSPVDLPEDYYHYPEFYDQMNGGVKTVPHKKNPYTKKPYAPNKVKLGDYARVIAEYWVDGVKTASPPGHWINILTAVNSNPLLEKRWGGKGPVLDDLEWDIKTQFVMCGAMHDAGIACWGTKGYYDYVRPITAIRYMAEQGQCSDPNLPRYHREGLPLIEGKIELVKKRDPLAGENGENINKIKIYTWKGPDYIDDVYKDMAGVGWILAENWWPYQRYSFATPPFAGYTSGHSTFSVAGAEVMTLITGDSYFPGGLMEFTAKKNEFLEFEEGPSEDIVLQWATYHDAANETCLSRIWGGIHPPMDDIPARKMGLVTARKAFRYANTYFR